MTAEQYREAGFEVSSYIEQAVIDRAEADVEAAYIAPILGETVADPETLKQARMNLAHLLILQRGIFATRAGAKVKTTASSMQADTWQQLQEQAATCHLYLQQLAATEGAKNDPVLDVCKIYFKSNFLFQ